MRTTLVWAGLSLLLAPAGPLAGQADWQLRKEKDGIQVFFRESATSNIKELKIRTRFAAPLAAMVALLSDVENFPRWMDHCHDVRKIRERGPTNYVYYNRANFPWPLSDREFVMHCTARQDPETLTVTFRSEAAPDALPLNKKYIRVRQTISQWRLTPHPDGILDVEYYLQADPGGSIPAWMVNMALDSGPVKAMQKLRELTQLEDYRNLRLAYIRER